MSEPLDSSKDSAGIDQVRSDEPTVLDWFRSLFKLTPIRIPSAGSTELDVVLTHRGETEIPRREVVPNVQLKVNANQFRLPLALGLAFAAQIRLENRSGQVWLSAALYLLAAALLSWALWRRDFSFEQSLEATTRSNRTPVRVPYLIAGCLLAVLTYLFSGGNEFRPLTLIVWSASLACIFLGLWQGGVSLVPLWSKLKSRLRDPSLHLTLGRWQLVLLFAFAIAGYFRFHRLADVPNEMWSDQAEKLLDVVDVLEGRFSIFFPRNTGREALQFYLAAATAKWLGTGISFQTLKIGTTMAGFLTLPFIYLLGREVGGRDVGLAALLLAGVGYWPNVISRVGLRFPLYPLLAAPALYFLIRGLRRGSLNSVLVSGLAIGLGLHGYSPARAIPILAAVGVGLYLLHSEATGRRRSAIAWFLAAGLVALIVAIPLIRTALEMPDQFLERTLTRIGTTERPLPGPVGAILLSNLWNAMRMFAWDNGEIWVVSIPHRPAFDWITAAFFHLGLALLLVRYLKERNWMDAFLLLAIPVLMLPSMFSLAFPNENPALNRAGGALVPAFVVAALPLAAIPRWASSTWRNKHSRVLGIAAAGGLFIMAAGMNHDLVFVKYAEQLRRSSWNTSEAGGVIRAFAESIGDYDSAFVVAYPHWLDARLVGIEAGRPTRDYTIWPDQLESLGNNGQAMLFLVNPNDEEGLAQLRDRFPAGKLSRWVSASEGRDFLIYFVAPTNDLLLAPSGVES